MPFMTAVSGATSPRPRRERDKARHIFGGTGAAIVAIIAIAVIASACDSGHAVTTSGSSAAPASSAARASSTPAATVGSTLALTGAGADEHMAVTVTKVYLHAKPASEGDGPGPGDRLVAVQFRLLDTGSGFYSDVPSQGALVFDASGQSYFPSQNDTANCPAFPGRENIAPGQSGLGCIVFQVPQAAVVTEVQFGLDGGMAPEAGQWDVGR